MLSDRLADFLESLWDDLWTRRGRKGRPDPSEPAPPWDAWELDQNFFTALSRWTLEHPESSLDRVMKRVCVGIERSKDLIELIPNSPFPASGLIGALAHLVKLGTIVSKATRDVQVFAKEIVHWVGEVKSTFEHGGRFSSKMWKNLREIRALIDEICKWATARLEDGRWSRIGHGLSITKEIEEFQARLAKARTLFIDRAVINLAQGQDVIFQNVRELITTIQQKQAEQLTFILDELEEQRIMNEEQNKAEARRQFLAQILSTRAVTNTAYDEQGKRPCDSDTRIDILTDIKIWVHDISDSAQRFLWLTGDPGSGKSAITASIARGCKDDGILWAQFFINRNISSTTNPASYFPSIARQLADHSRDVALALHDTLKERPSLMDDISQDQAGKLFVDALKVASLTDPSKPVVVIIDGLDETDTNRLRYTAKILSNALVDLPSNTKVFISSRTEDDIRRPFSATFSVGHVKHIHLDVSANSSIRDVSTFLERRVADIVVQNDLDWSQWPGEERMQGLCKQASGLFIWAVTTVKFIQVQIDTWGSECLDDVLDELNSKGMGDINVLYGTILRLTHRDQTDPWAFERFRRMVGCIVVLQEPLCLADIATLLNLRKAISSAPVDIEHYVRRLRTVLVAGADAIDGCTVPRLHKSFFEFIISERADPQFRVDMDKSNGEVAVQCLAQFAGLKVESLGAVDSSVPPSGNSPRGSFPAPLRYAFRFLTSHLPQAGQTTAGVLVAGSIDIPDLLEMSQHWSHGNPLPSCFNVAFWPDKKRLVCSSGDAIRLWDAQYGTRIESPRVIPTAVHACAFSPNTDLVLLASLENSLRLWSTRSGEPVKEPFKTHAGIVPLSVAFSADGTRVVSGLWDSTLCVWDARTGEPVGEPFEGHAGCVHSVGFAPDGTLVVSGSDDNTVRVWDTHTGLCIGGPFVGHTDSVRSVAFSPDGNLVVSGSSDGTLRLWDVPSGQPFGEPLEGHTKEVDAVAFSPSGTLVVSGSWDKTLCVWDVQSGQPIGEWAFAGHTGPVTSLAFSPDGKLVASGSMDNTVRLWNAQSGQRVGEPFTGHTHTVLSVAFSSEGRQVVSVAQDSTIRFWDVASGHPVTWPIQGHTDKVSSCALSPDHAMIASASLDGTVRIWSAHTGEAIGSALGGDIAGVVSVVFSPDGRLIAAASLDGTVRLWDSESHQLMTSYQKKSVSGITCITFSPDGKQLRSWYVDGSAHTWEARSGQQTQSSAVSLLEHNRSISFTLEKGWHHDVLFQPQLRWFPVDSDDFGLWAYTDGKIIRSDPNGSTRILDVLEGFWKQGTSV